MNISMASPSCMNPDSSTASCGSMDHGCISRVLNSESEPFFTSAVLLLRVRTMMQDRGSGGRICVSSRAQHTTLPLTLATLLAPQAQLIFMATLKANMVEQEHGSTRQQRVSQCQSSFITSSHDNKLKGSQKLCSSFPKRTPITVNDFLLCSHLQVIVPANSAELETKHLMYEPYGGHMCLKHRTLITYNCRVIISRNFQNTKK